MFNHLTLQKHKPPCSIRFYKNIIDNVAVKPVIDQCLCVYFREVGHAVAAGQRHAGRERQVHPAGRAGEERRAHGHDRGARTLLPLHHVCQTRCCKYMYSNTSEN